MKPQKKESFINFWEFLEIPMNSPIGIIKKAFGSKFTKIKNSIDEGENIYSQEDLKTSVSAYETLINPYSRFLHNCQIDGEDPPKDPDWDSYFSDNGISDDDLSDKDNQSFLAWLLSTAIDIMKKSKEISSGEKHFNNGLSNAQAEFFMEIANILHRLFLEEQEKQKKKESQKKRPKFRQ